MPEHVGSTNPEGVDYGWVLQVTFVVSIVVGFPIAALLALDRSLPTWTSRAVFAIRVAAFVWLVVGLVVLGYAKYHQG